MMIRCASGLSIVLIRKDCEKLSSNIAFFDLEDLGFAQKSETI